MAGKFATALFLTVMLATAKAEAQPNYNGTNQQTAMANMSATLVATLTPLAPEVFELTDITVSTESDGTIVIAPGGSTTTTGGVTVTSPDGGSELAITISGSGDYVYTLTLPTTITVDDDETGGITITDVTTNAANNGQLSSGADPVLLGVTVHVPQAEEEGTYQLEADIEVGVNFN